MAQRTRAQSRDDGQADQPLNAKDAAEVARELITELTGQEPVAMTSVEFTDQDGWIVEFEVVRTGGSRRRRTSWRCTKSRWMPTENCWGSAELGGTCGVRRTAGVTGRDDRRGRQPGAPRPSRSGRESSAGQPRGHSGAGAGQGDRHRWRHPGQPSRHRAPDDQAASGRRLAGHGEGGRHRLVGERPVANRQEVKSRTGE